MKFRDEYINSVGILSFRLLNHLFQTQAYCGIPALVANRLQCGVVVSPAVNRKNYQQISEGNSSSPLTVGTSPIPFAGCPSSDSFVRFSLILVFWFNRLFDQLGFKVYRVQGKRRVHIGFSVRFRVTGLAHVWIWQTCM